MVIWQPDEVNESYCMTTVWVGSLRKGSGEMILSFEAEDMG